MLAYTQYTPYPEDGPLRRLLRIACSGVAFITFAFGGLLISGLFPIVALLPGGREKRQERVRGLIRWGFGTFISWLCTLRLCDTHIHHEDRKKLKQPAIIIANHPSLIDVVFLYSLLPKCVCVIKKGVWNNPFMALPVRTAGFVPNTTPQDLIDRCVENLINGHSVMIFPEGSRSLADGPRPFKRGAAHIALRSGHPILPVTITLAPPTLAKGSRWYQMADRTSQFVLEFDEPIEVKSWRQSDDPESLAVRKLTEYLEAYYAERLEGYYPSVNG